MPFTLHPATVDDAPTIASIFAAAFADDHIMSHFHPHVPSSVLFYRDFTYYRDLIAQGHIYGERITKAVDEESGEIVAFSAWQYPYTLTEGQSKEKEARDRNRKDEPPEGSNDALIKDFFTQLFEGRKKWIMPEKTFFLHILAVSPTYQRHGLGTQLIRPGLAAADAAGAQTYIEASPAGLPLYLRHGWKQVDEMVLDMGLYGGSGVERQPFLMREAEAAVIGVEVK